MKTRPYRYAGFWVRFAALVLDSIVFGIGASILGSLVGMAVAAISVHLQLSDLWAEIVDDTADLLIDLILTTAYWVLFTAGPWHATPGKRFFRLYVIRANGAPIGLQASFSRYCAYGLSAAPLMIGFMMAGWNREKKALHDITSRTRVVYGRPADDGRYANFGLDVTGRDARF